jgi:hypothetical protein
MSNEFYFDDGKENTCLIVINTKQLAWKFSEMNSKEQAIFLKAFVDNFCYQAGDDSKWPFQASYIAEEFDKCPKLNTSKQKVLEYLRDLVENLEVEEVSK